MRNTKAERTARFYTSMASLGFDYQEADRLRRIEMTLQRWAELECGDGNDYASWAIERDETTGKPYRCIYPHQGEKRRHAVPDRERGALRRLAGIMRGHPELVAYHQGDCRGCMLYILRASDVKPGESIGSVYTRGFAVSS